MPRTHTKQTRSRALLALQLNAEENGGVPNWAKCARETGVGRQTLQRWWGEGEGVDLGGFDGVEPGRTSPESPDEMGAGEDALVKARELLAAKAVDARAMELALVIESLEQCTSDAGRAALVKEHNRLVEAYGAVGEARVVSPGEWVVAARDSVELLYEAVLGCDQVMERLGVGC